MNWQVSIIQESTTKGKTFNLSQNEAQQVLKRAEKIKGVYASGIAIRNTPKGDLLYILHIENGTLKEEPTKFLTPKR